MKKSNKPVRLADIKETFVVRLELNPSRVAHLQSLYEAGEDLPQLKVTEELELIDGRHRLAALKNLGFTEADVDIGKYDTLADKVVAALHCNVGGALPPNNGDIGHVIQILLAEKVSRTEIIRRLSETVGLPMRLIRNQIDYVVNNATKARMKKAIAAVLDKGMTVPNAAAEYGVQLDSLKSALRSKGSKKDGPLEVQQLKSHLGQTFGRANTILGHNLSHLSRDLQDGVTSPEEVQDVMAHVEKLVGRVNRVHEDWKKRFTFKAGVTEKVATIHREKARRPAVNSGKRTLEKMGIGQD